MGVFDIFHQCSPAVQRIFSHPKIASPDPFWNVRAFTIGLDLNDSVEDDDILRMTLYQEKGVSGWRDEVGKTTTTYLDTTATSLPLHWIADTRAKALPYYGNTHTTVHRRGKVMTEACDAVHEMVLEFVHANRETHTAFFSGSGATAPLNHIAEILQRESPDGYVVISEMDHHANLLPWMERFAGRFLIVPVDRQTGTVRLEVLEDYLADERYRGKIRLVAVTGVSNVTGIENDIREISRLSHEAGAEVLIDAAQMGAHLPIDMQELGIDWLVFSAHKNYAPGGPGIGIGPKKHLTKHLVRFGGGMIRSVSTDGFIPTHRLPDLLEPGTQNILGTIQLGAALLLLDSIGMGRVTEHEKGLTRMLIDGLLQFQGAITVYADTDLTRTPRAGVVSFNLDGTADGARDGLHHESVALALDLFFNISVRSGCFCAHPYVKALLGFTPEDEAAFIRAVLADEKQLPGMVRASTGIYTTEKDIRRLLSALELMIRDKKFRERVKDLRSDEFCQSPV